MTMTEENERRRPKRYRLKEDDPPFRLKSGDIVVAIPYWLDPREKITVLYRESDHYDPSCNLYFDQVERVRDDEDGP